jgi:hypothetical protein
LVSRTLVEFAVVNMAVRFVGGREGEKREDKWGHG